jgi:uncharacterized membrane protein
VPARISLLWERVLVVAVFGAFTLVVAFILVVVAGATFFALNGLSWSLSLLCGPTLRGASCYEIRVRFAIAIGAVIALLTAIALFRKWIRQRRLTHLVLAVAVAISTGFGLCQFLAHANWGI